MGRAATRRAMMPLAGLLVPVLLLAPGAAVAEEPDAPAAADCPAKPAPLPDGLVGWSAPSTDRAMTKYYPRAHWLRGLNTRLALNPIDRVAYVTVPEKAIEPNSYGGLMSVRVQKPGRLKIALGERAWVDLVKGGKRWTLVPSAAHGHGPACTSIAKIVEYDVEPGHYVIQIVNAPAAKLQAMAVAPR